MKALVDY